MYQRLEALCIKYHKARDQAVFNDRDLLDGLLLMLDELLDQYKGNQDVCVKSQMA